MINAEIVGDRQVIERLSRIGTDLNAELKVSVTRAAIMLMAYVKSSKLSGDVLNVKTGRLRRSVNETVKSDDKSVIGSVGTNVNYGKYWELGFDRKVGAGARGGLGARGGKIPGPRGIAAYYAKHPAGTKHFGARSFLAAALADKRQEILEEINGALTRTINK